GRQAASRLRVRYRLSFRFAIRPSLSLPVHSHSYPAPHLAQQSFPRALPSVSEGASLMKTPRHAVLLLVLSLNAMGANRPEIQILHRPETSPANQQYSG